MFKKLLLFSVCVSFLLFAVSCKEKEKIYSHAELVIPLTEDFYDTNDPLFDVSYSNGEISVAVLRISFAAGILNGIPETFSPDRFAKYWLSQNERQAEIIVRGDYAICDYIESGTFHLASFFRAKNAYFVILFATREALEVKWRDKMLEFSNGVYFTD